MNLAGEDAVIECESRKLRAEALQRLFNPHADHMYGVLQKESCDHVLETPAAKFFGLSAGARCGSHISR